MYVDIFNTLFNLPKDVIFRLRVKAWKIGDYLGIFFKYKIKSSNFVLWCIYFISNELRKTIFFVSVTEIKAVIQKITLNTYFCLVDSESTMGIQGDTIRVI